jgi:hypothetical protein
LDKFNASTAAAEVSVAIAQLVHGIHKVDGATGMQNAGAGFRKEQRLKCISATLCRAGPHKKAVS